MVYLLACPSVNSTLTGCEPSRIGKTQKKAIEANRARKRSQGNFSLGRENCLYRATGEEYLIAVGRVDPKRTMEAACKVTADHLPSLPRPDSESRKL
jgi:hypothetical protein